MRVEVHPDADAARSAAARHLAAWIEASAPPHGRCTLALSGRSTPGPAFRRLAREALPWDRVRVFQVDERVVPAGSPERNLSLLGDTLVASGSLPADRLHPMPVEEEDLDAAAARYAECLAEHAGRPPRLDVVHLGLGADGHTASLFPGDPAAEIDDRAVVPTAEHDGRRRMTLTRPVLDAAEHRLWLVCGADKAAAVSALLRGDRRLPAARVRRAGSLLVMDAAAAPCHGAVGPRSTPASVTGR